jgi:hypothetical protein
VKVVRHKVLRESSPVIKKVLAEVEEKDMLVVDVGLKLAIDSRIDFA